MIDTQLIRFRQIPDMTVASIQCVSTSPEKDSLDAVINFIKENNTSGNWSAVRHFGYVPQYDKGGVADIDIFERLVTIPNDMKISKPFVKKIIPGGLYASYTLPLSFFDKAVRLKEAINAMPNYRLITTGKFDHIEEYLNGWLFSSTYADQFFAQVQIDILLRVQRI